MGDTDISYSAEEPISSFMYSFNGIRMNELVRSIKDGCKVSKNNALFVVIDEAFERFG